MVKGWHFWGLVQTLSRIKKFYTEAEQEETHGVALVGLPAERETAHMVSLVWTVECALGL